LIGGRRTIAVRRAALINSTWALIERESSKRLILLGGSERKLVVPSRRRAKAA
jgi:hypothetical protein